MHSLHDFVGTYTIRHGSGSLGPEGSSVISVGNRLAIGEGRGVPKADGIKVGVAILDPDGEFVLPAPKHPPFFAYCVEGTLNGSAYWFGDSEIPQLMSFQISLCTLKLAGGGTYKAPSILVTIGDPDNAGVWGADDS